MGDDPSAGDGRPRATSVAAWRRKLPRGRLAVLMVGERSHIVGLADVSVSGAYLLTRLRLAVGDVHSLRLVVAAGSELAVSARIVRTTQASDESPDQRWGVGVEFLEMSPSIRQRLEAFVASGAKTKDGRERSARMR